MAAREADADEFYAALAPAEMGTEEMRVLRQSCAGLVWSKQIYPYQVRRWLDGDPAQPPPPEGHRHGRNSGWRHLDSFDVLAMPDPWEYPWFAAWDLAFHTISWAHLDPAFAKYQLLVLLRVVPAPQRGAPGVRVELRRRQPASPRAGRPPGVRHRRRPGPRLPGARLPEAVAELHLVAQPPGSRRQQPLRRRVPRPRQHLSDRSIAPASRRPARPGRRHRVGGLLLDRHAELAVASPTDDGVYDDMVVKFLEQSC